MQIGGGVRFRQPVWACLAVLLACAAPAAKAETGPSPNLFRELVSGRILRPAAGAVLVPGELAEIRWTALPVTVSECELLLSLDGGREFTVRLTPQLRGTTHELSWRVPNLPAPQARLRLRVGVAGHEIESAVSPAFSIVAAPMSPLASLRFAYGEWWTSPIPSTSQADYPTCGTHIGPVPESAGEALLALLPEEPVPFAPSSPTTVPERPIDMRGREVKPVRGLTLQPVAPPQRE